MASVLGTIGQWTRMYTACNHKLVMDRLGYPGNKAQRGGHLHGRNYGILWPAANGQGIRGRIARAWQWAWLLADKETPPDEMCALSTVQSLHMTAAAACPSTFTVQLDAQTQTN